MRTSSPLLHSISTPIFGNDRSSGHILDIRVSVLDDFDVEGKIGAQVEGLAKIEERALASPSGRF
jgi:hypothetical protein